MRQGVDVVTVAGLMGHSRLETTRRYSAPTEDDIAARLAAIDAEQLPGQTSIPLADEPA